MPRSSTYRHYNWKNRLIRHKDLVITVCGILSRFAAITPGAIGIREALMAAGGHLTGIDYQVVLVAAGLDRLIQMVFVFATGGVLLWRERQKALSRDLILQGTEQTSGIEAVVHER